MDGMLSQDEINALLNGGGDSASDDSSADTASAGDTSVIDEELISDIEKDAIGEVANISMGSSATTLFSLVNLKVDITTPVVTMANIHVVTDYMQQEEFLNGEGEVRSITLSELGYTSSEGEELQAAAIVYAYKMAEMNPYIDAILFSRQTDAEDEIRKLKLYLGLDHTDGTHKYAYDVYKYMDTEEAEKYTEFAKELIGEMDFNRQSK